MGSVEKDSGTVFFTNLAAVTGNGSLVKLDLADERAMQKRIKLVEQRHRKVGVFTSAVMIYFCNILDQNGFAKDSKDKVSATVSVADLLTTGWVLYDTGRDKKKQPYSTVEQISEWINGKLIEAFSYGLDLSIRPSGESLKYIMEDFARISKVSDSLFLVKQ